MLVVVASKEGISSIPIKTEIETFPIRRRPVLLIDIENDLRKSEWFSLVSGAPSVSDTAEALSAGRPSANVLAAITSAASFWRRDQILKAAIPIFVAVAFFAVALGVLGHRSSNAATSRELASEALQNLANGELGGAVVAASTSLRTARTAEALDAAFAVTDAVHGLDRVLFGHSDAIIGLAFDPDDKHLVSLDSTASVFRWVSATGRLDREPVKGMQQMTPWGFAFNSVANRVAVGLLGRGGVHLGDLKTLQPIPIDSRTSSRPTYCVAFSPNGTTLAAGDQDGIVSFWSAETGASLGQFQRHKGPVTRLAFSRDNRLLASAGGDGSVILSEAQPGHSSTGRVLKPELAGPVYALMFDPDSRWLAAGAADGTILLWNLKKPQAKGNKLVSTHGNVLALDFSLDGRWLVSGYADGSVIVWPTEGDLSIARSIREHSAGVSALAFSPDGKWFASSGIDGTVLLWSTETRLPLRPALRAHHGPATALTFSHDSKILASGGMDGKVALWKTDAKERSGEILHNSSGAVAVSPTTNMLVAGGVESGIFLYSASAKSETIPTNAAINSLAFDSAGTKLITGYDNGHVGLWYVPQGFESTRQLRDLPTTLQSVYTVTSDQSGRHWAAAGQAIINDQTAGVIVLSDKRDELAVMSSGDHAYGVLVIAFSPDSQHIVSGGMDGRVILWTRETQRWVPAEIASVKNYVQGIAYNRDGKQIAWAEDSGTVAIFDTRTHRRTDVSRTDFGRAYSVTFSPDGEFLVAGGRLPGVEGEENAILVWDIKSGKRIGPLRPVDGDGPQTLVFSADGKLLVSAVRKGPVAVWNFDPVGLLEHACLVARPNLTPDEWKKFLPDHTYPATCE